QGADQALETLRGGREQGAEVAGLPRVEWLAPAEEQRVQPFDPPLASAHQISFWLRKRAKSAAWRSRRSPVCRLPSWFHSARHRSRSLRASAAALSGSVSRASRPRVE